MLLQAWSEPTGTCTSLGGNECICNIVVVFITKFVFDFGEKKKVRRGKIKSTINKFTPSNDWVPPPWAQPQLCNVSGITIKLPSSPADSVCVRGWGALTANIWTNFARMSHFPHQNVRTWRRWLPPPPRPVDLCRATLAALSKCQILLWMARYPPLTMLFFPPSLGSSEAAALSRFVWSVTFKNNNGLWQKNIILFQ